jgi:hypothetical protein
MRGNPLNSHGQDFIQNIVRIIKQGDWSLVVFKRMCKAVGNDFLCMAQEVFRKEGNGGLTESGNDF